MDLYTLSCWAGADKDTSTGLTEHKLKMLKQQTKQKKVSGSEHQQFLTRRSSKIISDAESGGIKKGTIQFFYEHFVNPNKAQAPSPGFGGYIFTLTPPPP